LCPSTIEVKCPYSVRDSDIFAKDVHKKVHFLELVEGEFTGSRTNVDMWCATMLVYCVDSGEQISV
jgi:hypothetical protein